MADQRANQHPWLGRLVGEWTWEMEAEGEPGQPPITDSGTESVRSLGVWVIFEAGGTTPQGNDVASIMSIGYDPERGRFQGTFLSSMMTYLWIYEGSLDAAENVLTLNAEGPSYTEEGKMAKYRDTIELRGDDHRVHTSSFQAGDGQWRQFMTTHYRRAR